MGCSRLVQSSKRGTDVSGGGKGNDVLEHWNSEFIRLIPAVGMSPIDADSTAPFIRSNENIITVNVAELSSSEPLLVRRNVIKMWKGIENDVILRTPRGLSSFEEASFLSMHKVKKVK